MMLASMAEREESHNKVITYREMTNKYAKSLVSNIVKRSGICTATVERVLPAVFDEIRHQLVEGPGVVCIESFGTLAVIDIPERQYHYTYKGRDELKTVAPTKRIKFAPARSFRREVDAGQFDTRRESFKHFPSDPPLRGKSRLKYQKNEKGFHRSGPSRDVDGNLITSGLR